MSRPPCKKKISSEPSVLSFTPKGKCTGCMNISMAEYEALKLVEVCKMDQKQAAKKMCISQPTLSRVLTSARKKLATALVLGNCINIKR